jgi:anti-anti-sigma regulatory factor
MKIKFEELNIYEIEKFHQNILKDIQTSKTSFTLNFADVQKIDLSNIQLILSLKKYCDKKKIKLNITNITAKSVKQTLKMFNLNSTLGVE